MAMVKIINNNQIFTKELSTLYIPFLHIVVHYNHKVNYFN